MVADIVELRCYRELLFSWIARSMKVRYQQWRLGAGWVSMQSAINITIGLPQVRDDG